MGSEHESSMSRQAADALAAARVEHEKAEAAKALQEAEKARIEAENARVNLRRNEFIIAQDEHKFRLWQAEDDFKHVYYFLTPVTEASAHGAIATLDMWDRLDPGCDMTFVFNSPGGDVIAGLALYDHIQMMRRAGHRVTTIAEGFAASMAGILLQAGDTRVMSAEAYVLIHEISFGVRGKVGDVEDELAFVKKVQNRVLDIFADRCKKAGEAGTASAPLTRGKLKSGWERKDWWLSSAECLKFGIVDEVR